MLDVFAETTEPESLYQILPPETIRLLKLQPSSDPEEPLQCSLQAITFRNTLSKDTLVPYETLSYSWGDPVFTYPLKCNSSTLLITSSLSIILHHLRLSDCPRVLWIDAICINQASNEDKVQQILTMRNIYARASRVIIWLGPEDETTAPALEMLDRALKEAQLETGLPIPNHKYIKGEEPDEARNSARGFPAFDDKAGWAPLLALFSRSWFSRTWIIQEATLADMAVVKVGSREILWQELGFAAQWFGMKGYVSVVRGLVPVLLRVLSLWYMSRVFCAADGQRYDENKRTPLLSLLRITRKAKASKPLDRIYGILSLAEEEKKFEIDYGKSVRDLYTEVAREILCHPDNRIDLTGPAILSEAKNYEDTANTNWPSWVPQWQDYVVSENQTDMSFSRNRALYTISQQAKKFHAGGPHNLYTGARTVDTDKYAILVEGFVFDTIKSNTNFLETPPESREYLWSLIEDIHSVGAEPHGTYPGGESVDEALALTLTLADPLDTFSRSSKAETYHAIDWQHFCLAIMEQTKSNLTKSGCAKEVEAFFEKWEGEHDELKRLVGEHQKSPHFSRHMQGNALGRRLFGTAKGYLGIGENPLQTGDIVCVLFGAGVPMILRLIGGSYRVVGECYLHGIMEGEALAEGLSQRQWFELR
jgi:hypothetical protein